jgi:hypothetical protein
MRRNVAAHFQDTAKIAPNSHIVLSGSPIDQNTGTLLFWNACSP